MLMKVCAHLSFHFMFQARYIWHVHNTNVFLCSWSCMWFRLHVTHFLPTVHWHVDKALYLQMPTVGSEFQVWQLLVFGQSSTIGLWKNIKILQIHSWIVEINYKCAFIKTYKRRYANYWHTLYRIIYNNAFEKIALFFVMFKINAKGKLNTKKN